MKKIKTIGLMMILSLGLAANIFAIGPVTAAPGVIPGLLSFAIEQVLSLFRGADDCPLRQCQDCHPNNGQGDCRPE